MIQRRPQPRPAAPVPPAGPAAGALPYDFAARFELQGLPGRIAHDVLTIPSDGPFVAVAIGYGFQQDRARPLAVFPPPPPPPAPAPAPVVPGDLTLGQLPVQALVEGFRLNPRSENIVLRGDSQGAGQEYSTQPVPQELANKALELVQPPEEVSFLFSLVDSGSGRELQDEPTHNLASLGRADGERPFRPLAQPLYFLPRSTVRMQVVERTPGARGALYVVLYGYRLLTGSACPEPILRALQVVEAGRAGRGGRVVPFDHVAKFTLAGRPGNALEDEVVVNVDGAFVATAIGYGLAVDTARATFLPSAAGAALLPGPARIDLAALPLRAIPPDVLREGLRVRPEYLRIVLDAGGALRQVPLAVAELALERLGRPEDVSFLYTLSDTGAGHDWQNRPIHNVAGLGIASGLRPFKKLARPRVFPPRSVLRVRVEEDFGSGTLYLAFQGYKVLGQGGRS